MTLTETLLEEKIIYEGKVIAVKNDRVLLSNSKEAFREVVLHNGGVCILAIDENEEIYMVNQFRYPYNKEILELPAGKIDKGESPENTGKRELFEEVGLKADTFISLGQMYPSPGYTNEIIYIYLAKDLYKTNQRLDEDEFLSVVKMPFKKAYENVLNGEIKDAKTITAILRGGAHLGLIGLK